MMSDVAQTSGPGGNGRVKVGRLDPKSLARLILGVIFLAGSIGYLMMAFDMPLGSLDAPGPGTFPVGVGVLSIVVGIIVILESLFGGGPTGDIDVPTGFERKQAIYFLATFIGLVLILPVLGQYVSSGLYVVITLKLLGGMSWIRSIIVGTAMGAGITALFAELLNVPLPSGIW